MCPVLLRLHQESVHRQCRDERRLQLDTTQDQSTASLQDNVDPINTFRWIYRAWNTVDTGSLGPQRLLFNNYPLPARSISHSVPIAASFAVPCGMAGDTEGT